MWKFLVLSLIAFNGLMAYEDAYLSSEDSYVLKERMLVYVQILTTNGIYTPLETYPNSQNSANTWKDGFGTLTRLGKLQHYELGKVLRDYYRNFITSSPVEIDEFSSAEDRSTHSLLCMLASLYAPTDDWQFLPGFKWQPIPVSYLDSDDIFFRYPENCETQLIDLEKLYTTSPGKDFIEKDKFHYSLWSNHSGMLIENWNDVAYLFDILEKERTLGLKVPAWASKYWHHLERLTDAAHGWNYQTVRSLQLKIGPLLQFMTVRMRAKKIVDDPTKVSVYMTHDWNLSAFLSAIRRYNGRRPPPGATVTIELYKESTSRFSVRMLFFNATHPELGRQEPHLLTLQNCEEYCPIETFAKHLEPLIPENFYSTCGQMLEVDSAYGSRL
uniref:acid phosphatase n=1 Tax=Parasteatoda tepidariorum TaxID=114398 RepID=A0A2L2YRR3_PARTP